MMLHKSFSFEVKAEGDDVGIIEGYGSTFGGAPDSYGDIVARGAFAATIAEHKAAGTMPSMLWGHQMGDVPIGDWTDMREDRKGLFLRGRIDVEDAVGARVYRAVKAKRVRGLSIGYDVAEFTRDDKKGIRTLEKVNLWEVSPVTFPANVNAGVTMVKSVFADGLPSLSEFEKFLREAGFSKTQATAIASKGLSHLIRSESGSASDADDYVAALRALLPN